VLRLLYEQLFGFGFPGYGGTLRLPSPSGTTPTGALGSALVSRTMTSLKRPNREAITQEVRNAVHQLEEARLALSAGQASFDLAQKTLAPSSANSN